MSFVSSIFEQINLGGNWLLILVFLGIGGVAGVALGKNKLNLITLAGYFSFVITKFIPWKQLGLLGEKSAPDSNVQTFLFLAIILAIFFLTPHSGFGSVVRVSGRGRGKAWQLAILGILELGFFVSVIISFLPAKTLSDLGPLFKQFFASPIAQFLWLLLPLVAMFALKRRRQYSYGEDD